MLFTLLLLLLPCCNTHAMEENTQLLHSDNQDIVLNINTNNSIGINETSAWDILKTLENKDDIPSLELKGKAYDVIVNDFLGANQHRIFKYPDVYLPDSDDYLDAVDKNITTFIKKKNMSPNLETMILQRLNTEQRIYNKVSRDATRHCLSNIAFCACAATTCLSTTCLFVFAYHA
ncbi:MAG: hypothetical protein WCE21_02590 [Candidatus Babeliales bacterium]